MPGTRLRVLGQIGCKKRNAVEAVKVKTTSAPSPCRGIENLHINIPPQQLDMQVDMQPLSPLPDMPSSDSRASAGPTQGTKSKLCGKRPSKLASKKRQLPSQCPAVDAPATVVPIPFKFETLCRASVRALLVQETIAHTLYTNNQLPMPWGQCVRWRDEQRQDAWACHTRAQSSR